MISRQRHYPLLLIFTASLLAGCNTPQQRAYNKPAPIPPPQQQTQGSETSGGTTPTSGEQTSKQATTQASPADASAANEQNEQTATSEACEPAEPTSPDVEITEVPLDEHGNPIEPVVVAANQTKPSNEDCKPAATANNAQQPKASDKQQAQQRAAGGPSGQRAQTGEERKAAANADLDQRLAAFDELMRRAQQAAARERDAAGSPAGSAGGLGANREMPEAERGAGGQADTASGLGHTPDESGDTRRGDYQHTAVGPVPADLPDGRDDDIVARQLREAASQENDPVLREKLWEEYRRYKGGL